MNKSKTKKKKVMYDKKLAKLLKKESKFKYNVRKDKTMKKCHNFCKNDYLPENLYEKIPSVKSFKSEEEKKELKNWTKVSKK